MIIGSPRGGSLKSRNLRNNEKHELPGNHASGPDMLGWLFVHLESFGFGVVGVSFAKASLRRRPQLTHAPIELGNCFDRPTCRKS